MTTDELGVPVAEGDKVALNVQQGMVQGHIVKLPGGLTLPGQQPGQPQVGAVAVVMHIQVLPNGMIPGIFKLAQTTDDKGSVQ